MAGYNGWKNYETWMVALWMDNEPGSQEFFREMAEDCISENEEPEDQERAFSNRLKGYWRESVPEVISGVWLDCINSILSEVDWDEIASHIVPDVRDEMGDGE